MNLYKLGIKIFVSNPATVNLRDFIPVFHGWIQQQKIAGHQLIDVHDYSHVHHGPGILLVAHEGNFSMDEADGRLGLFYYRKQPLDGLDANLKTILQAALQACRLLEAEPTLKGIRFNTDEILVVTNDRLLTPNTAATHAQLAPAIARAFANATVAPQSADPRERLAFIVRLVNR